MGTHFDQDAATPNDRWTLALLDEQLGKEPGFLAGFAFERHGFMPSSRGGAIRSPTDAFLSCATRLNIDRLYALMRLRTELFQNVKPHGSKGEALKVDHETDFLRT